MNETKRCGTCGRRKPRSEFHRNASRADGLQGTCKACKSTRDKQDYSANGRKQEIYERRQEQSRRLRAWVREYLSSHPCVDCGNPDWRVLEFDHLRDKRYSISEMVSMGLGLDTLIAEVAKCEVRCANCHRIKTRDTLWSVGELVDPPGSGPGDFAGSKPATPAIP